MEASSYTGKVGRPCGAQPVPSSEATPSPANIAGQVVLGALLALDGNAPIPALRDSQCALFRATFSGRCFNDTKRLRSGLGAPSGTIPNKKRCLMCYCSAPLGPSVVNQWRGSTCTPPAPTP